MWRGVEPCLQVERKGARSEGQDFGRVGTRPGSSGRVGGFDCDQTGDAVRLRKKYWVPEA